MPFWRFRMGLIRDYLGMAQNVLQIAFLAFFSRERRLIVVQNKKDYE